MNVSLRSIVSEGLDREPRSVLRDVFGVYGVNSTGARERSVRQQLERIANDRFVRVAVVTVRSPGSTAGDYANLQRDLDNASDVFFGSCGVWVYCSGVAVVQSGVLGTNNLLDQNDCNAGWLLDFIGIGDHEVSREEDALFDLGRSLGANIVGYYVGGAVSGFAGCAAHPGGRRGFWVSMTGSSQWTFGHELGHIVGDLRHSDNGTNLMSTPTGNITVNLPVLSTAQCIHPFVGAVILDPDVEGPHGLNVSAAPVNVPVARQVLLGDPVTAVLNGECGNPVLERDARNETTRIGLEEAVRDTSLTDEQRQRAIWALGLWSDDRMVATIVEVLDTLGEAPKQAAAATLARHRSDASFGALETLAQDPSPDVQRVVRNRLNTLDDPRALSILHNAN